MCAPTGALRSKLRTGARRCRCRNWHVHHSEITWNNYDLRSRRALNVDGDSDRRVLGDLEERSELATDVVAFRKWANIVRLCHPTGHVYYPLCAIAGRYIEQCHACVEDRHSNLQVVEQVKLSTNKVSAADWVMSNIHVDVRGIDGKFNGLRARRDQCAMRCGRSRLRIGD